MIVVCIENIHYDTIMYLTINKQYNVSYLGDTMYYKVLNDIGEHINYNRTYFITLDEYREIKINQLI